MRAPAVAVTLLVAMFSAACSGAADGTLLLDWRFADGRDCVNAGATHVELRLVPPLAGDQAAATFDCSAGEAPAMVTATMVPEDGTLYVDARSPYDGDLYRGQLSLDDAFAAVTTTTTMPTPTATVTVTLYAAAAN